VIGLTYDNATLAEIVTSIGRLENAPLADRARSAILAAILAGEFTKRLPPEEVLAEMINVSRTTIRSALQSLEQDGVVSRTRAVGTVINAHVRPSTLALQRLVGFDGLLREKGYDVRVEVEWHTGKPGDDFAAAFQLAADENYVLTEKRYYAAGKVAIAIRDALPCSNLISEQFEEPLPASLFEFSTRYCRRKVDHAVVEIVARVKDGSDGVLLDLAAGQPFTRLHESHYSSKGEPLAFSLIDNDNAYIRFEIFRRG
jgi:GntR family transcriptional regulator